MLPRLKSLLRQRGILLLTGFTLACAWPGVGFLAHNAATFQWLGGSTVLGVVVVSLAIWVAGLLVFAAPALVWRRWPLDQALAVGVALVFLAFSQVSLRLLVMEGTGMTWPESRWPYLGVVAVCVWLAARLSRYEPFRLAVVIAILFMMVPPAVTLIGASRVGASAVGAAAPGPDAADLATLSRENVYVIILDGYAGPDSLEEAGGEGIRPFITRMEGMGFVNVTGARTNYTTTHVALAAALEMDYVATEQTPRYLDRRAFFPGLLHLGRPPRLVRQLTAAGYDFYHVGNPMMPCQPRAEISCLSRTSEWGFYKHVASVFLRPTRVTLGLIGLSGADGREYVALSAVTDAVDQLTRSARPFFLFVHHASPHPFALADCADASAGAAARQARPGDAADRVAYRASIECVNDAIQTLSARIQARDPNALVVFLADHGSDFNVNWTRPLGQWSDDAVRERADILTLARLPEPCRGWIKPGLTQINTMRLVVGCLQRRAPEFLDDVTYLSVYENNPDFGLVVDVTRRLERRH